MFTEQMQRPGEVKHRHAWKVAANCVLMCFISKRTLEIVAGTFQITLRKQAHALELQSQYPGLDMVASTANVEQPVTCPFGIGKVRRIERRTEEPVECPDRRLRIAE